MAADYSKGRSAPFKTPDESDGAMFEAAIGGLEAGTVRTRPLLELDAVGVEIRSEVDGATVEIVFSLPAAMRLATELTKAVARVAFRWEGLR